MFGEILTPINIMQTLGTGFGVMQVILSRQNNINNYLFGILAILLSTIVLYRSKLYGDILLNMYYLVMSVYGYFYWKYGKAKAERPISIANLTEQFYAISIVLACFGLMYLWLAFYTNSDVPIWDAVVSAFAWAGMWLMAKRKLGNWIYLNISNI
ncbi:MAG: nicotinamide riboside transporter PnuC, partial [Psychroflexus sp.]